MLRYFYIILFLFLAPFFLYSQGDIIRVEFEAEIDEDVFNVIPCGEHGIIVFYETLARADNKEKIWLFKYYDDQLKPIRNFEIPVINNAFFIDHATGDENLYFVFHNMGRVKQDEYNLEVLRFSFEQQDFTGIKAIIPEKASFVDMEVNQQNAYLGFNLDKFIVSIYLADFNAGTISTLNYENPAKAMLEDLYLDKESELLKAIVNTFISKKISRLTVSSYDFSGRYINDYHIKSDNPEIELNSARLIALNGEQELIMGTYNNAAAESSELKNEDEIISAGVYVSKITNQQQEFIKLYNFLDFQNYFSYVNPAEVLRLKKKSGRKADDRDYSLNYRLLLHDVLKHHDQYILLSEAYYPDYRTVSYITYDYYGRPFPQTYTVFEGYKYFSGIISGFDIDGNLLWDNGIKIWDITSFNLKKHISPFFDQSDLILVYSTDGKIASEIYNDGQIVGDFEYSELERKYRKDKIMEEENSYLTEWYDNYFIAYGYQEIRNDALAKSNRRTVFYINKLIFE